MNCFKRVMACIMVATMIFAAGGSAVFGFIFVWSPDLIVIPEPAVSAGEYLDIRIVPSSTAPEYVPNPIITNITGGIPINSTITPWDSNFRLSVPIPSGAAAGQHTIVIDYNDEEIVRDFEVLSVGPAIVFDADEVAVYGGTFTVSIRVTGLDASVDAEAIAVSILYNENLVSPAGYVEADGFTIYGLVGGVIYEELNGGTATVRAPFAAFSDTPDEPTSFITVDLLTSVTLANDAVLAIFEFYADAAGLALFNAGEEQDIIEGLAGMIVEESESEPMELNFDGAYAVVRIIEDEIGRPVVDAGTGEIIINIDNGVADGELVTLVIRAARGGSVVFAAVLADEELDLGENEIPFDDGGSLDLEPGDIVTVMVWSNAALMQPLTLPSEPSEVPPV